MDLRLESEIGLSVVEALVALALCGATAVVAASVMSLVAQNRAANQKDRRLLNAQNALVRAVGSQEHCTDVIRAASNDAAAGVDGISAWSLGAQTLTISRITVASLPSTTSGTASLTFSDAFARKRLAASDPSIYVRDLYLTNGVENSDGTYYYQAYADLVSPPPPVSGGTFAEELAPGRRPILFGTVQLRRQGAQWSCFSSGSQAGAGTGTTCSVSDDLSCRGGSVAVAFDSEKSSLTCVPIARGCYVGATVGGVRRPLHERVAFPGSACPAKPTGTTPLPAGVACEPTTTRTTNLHNCAFDAASGAWACSVWCALMNCRATI